MLHALHEFAVREGLIVTPGLKPKTVRWLLVFSPQGEFLGTQDLTGGDKKRKGREFPVCPDLTQSEMASIGGGCRHFLVDALDVVCLLTKDGEVNEKLAAKHEFFVRLLDDAGVCLPALAPIANMLRGAAGLQGIQARLAEGKAKPTDSATLAITDGKETLVFVEGNLWHGWWQGKRRRMAEGRAADSSSARKNGRADDSLSRMRCLLSGELMTPMRTQNKIEGLSDVGGLAMGDLLVSFDKDAFTSYGLQQGANAAMSEAMVKSYTTALNYLVRNQSRTLASAKVVYWYSGPLAREDDPLPDLFAGWGAPVQDDAEAEGDPSAAVAEKSRANSVAARLLEAFRSGEKPGLGDYRYYALTVSANCGRVVVRDWTEGPFTELLESVNAWFDDLAIVHRNGHRTVRSHKFNAVLAAPLRDLADAPGSLAAALWRCALKKTQPFPHTVMVQTLQRVRVNVMGGETPLHARLGLLKAYCNRNERMNMKPELNELETDPAYLCGRIMAILAAVQKKALPNVDAGVVQRYYAAASSTPALVLGRLVRLAVTAHFPKIEPDALRYWFENRLAETWAKLKQSPPVTLTLQGQTLFALGYYHQIATHYEGTTDDSKPEDAASNT